MKSLSEEEILDLLKDEERVPDEVLSGLLDEEFDELGALRSGQQKPGGIVHDPN